jgi:uncharacterized membrane-anchored protein YhcB (DUF1043 family)
MELRLMAIFDIQMHPLVWLGIGLAIGCVAGLLLQRQLGRSHQDAETEQLQREIDQWAYRTLGHEAAAEKARAELHANVAATIELKRKLTVLEQQHSVLTASLERNRALLDYTIKAYTDLRQRDAAIPGADQLPPPIQPSEEVDFVLAPEQRAQG